MIAIRRLLLCAALALCAPALAAEERDGGSPTAGELENGVQGGGAQADPDPRRAADAAVLWQDFRARAEGARAFEGFAVLDQVGYDMHEVDAAKCRERRAALADAVAHSPVSIAIRHASVLCARATGDAALAAREGEVLESLSRLALSQASDRADAPPITVLSPQDAFSLIASIGLEPAYQYYVLGTPRRYMPFVVVAWDEEAGEERHLSFDNVDAMNAVIRTDPYSDYPIQRNQLAREIVEQEAKGGMLMATDLLALREASTLGTVDAKVSRLREAAESGGVHSGLAWLALCEQQPASSRCADGLVDALLPGAEDHRAASMVLLAMAYANGTGIARDEAAASELLDAADRRWPKAGASAYFAAAWLSTHPGEVPAFVQRRVDLARRAGNPNIQNLLYLRSIGGSAPQLEATDIAYLADPADNAHGTGYGLLAAYYRGKGDESEALAWEQRAASAGEVDAMANQGRRKVFGQGVDKDEAGGRAMLADAAHGGSATAGRILAYLAMDDGHWQEAMSWLMAPMDAGDMQALLEGARIYEMERPGFTGDVARAVKIYTLLADQYDVADARRRLALMALEGRGMEKAPSRAEAWLRKDADRGDADSQALLGLSYLQGRFGASDEARGREWMEKAVQSGDSEAMSSYGLWLLGRHDRPEAMREGLSLLRRAVDREGGAGIAANNLAWALCTAPVDAIRDPERGLAVAKAMGKPEDLDVGLRDTVAACHAAVSDFDEAVRLQRSALEEFRRHADTGGDTARKELAETLERAGARLALYQARKSYRETEPPSP